MISVLVNHRDALPLDIRMKSDAMVGWSMSRESAKGSAENVRQGTCRNPSCQTCEESCIADRTAVAGL